MHSTTGTNQNKVYKNASYVDYVVCQLLSCTENYAANLIYCIKLADKTVDVRMLKWKKIVQEHNSVPIYLIDETIAM